MYKCGITTRRNIIGWGNVLFVCARLHQGHAKECKVSHASYICIKKLSPYHCV